MPKAEPSADLPLEERHRKNLFTSTLLITLTVVVALACIVILSCTLTQTRVASLVIDGVAISIPKLDYVGRKWVANRNESATLKDLEETKNKSLVSAATAVATANNKLTALEDKLSVFYFRVENLIPVLAATSAARRLLNNMVALSAIRSN
jgi:low affinity Fe/Cu permease